MASPNRISQYETSMNTGCLSKSLHLISEQDISGLRIHSFRREWWVPDRSNCQPKSISRAADSNCRPSIQQSSVLTSKPQGILHQYTYLSTQLKSEKVQSPNKPYINGPLFHTINAFVQILFHSILLWNFRWNPCSSRDFKTTCSKFDIKKNVSYFARICEFT